MGKLLISISNELEEELRDYIRRKGDLSRIISEALQLWITRKKGAPNNET